MKNKITNIFDVVRKNQLDILVMSVLAVIAGSASYFEAHRVDSSIILYDLWFDSDIPRVFDDMNIKWAWHGRTEFHLLFTLMTWLQVHFLKTQLVLRR